MTEENKKIIVAEEDKKDKQVSQNKKIKEENKKPKKEEAIARGVSLRISKKHGMYLCSFIKGKNIDLALKQLEEVLKFKRSIPFKGEVPHRKGKMMSGRYPINATGVFIKMLKALKGNVITNGLDLNKTVISYGMSNWASRPSRRRGSAKRTNVLLKAVERGNK